MGELDLIAQIRRGNARAVKGMVLGIGDDCAILEPQPRSELLVTTDFTLEGRHFRRDLHPAKSVGHRCLTRGLSDLAAMGGTPLAAFLSLALPKEMPATDRGAAWLTGFLGGLRALATLYDVPLAGGDTAESPADLVLADITVVGSAARGTALRRSTGRSGDGLYCTGRLGGAAAELEAMLTGGRLTGTSRGKMRWAGEHPQLFPEPRLRVGYLLRRGGWARACIDLSDGLSTDLGHLCVESGVGAEVEEALLPMHRLAARRGEARALELALHGGEDYELLFSASSRVKVPATIAGVEVTRIGKLVGAPLGQRKVMLVRKDGRREELLPGGWEHFKTTQ